MPLADIYPTDEFHLRTVAPVESELLQTFAPRHMLHSGTAGPVSEVMERQYGISASAVMKATEVGRAVVDEFLAQLES